MGTTPGVLAHDVVRAGDVRSTRDHDALLGSAPTTAISPVEPAISHGLGHAEVQPLPRRDRLARTRTVS
ncbi:Hypothetical protein A7982_01957 [Minicystis rosea]|nr:Hypothetical protein A7982_01957 [Minicystis rosea]